MMTEAHFEELVKDLLAEYLPKVKGAERKEFIAALLDELKANDVEFEEPFEAEEDYVEPLDFDTDD